MRLGLLAAFVASVAQLASASGQWSFEDGSVSIRAKGEGVGASNVKEKLTPDAQLPSTLRLRAADTLSVSLTATEDKKPKRPHQAFLVLREITHGLEEAFPINIKTSGKGKADITQKDLPYQLLTSEHPLEASIIVASFGQASPLHTGVFKVEVGRDQAALPAAPKSSVRYGKLEEIHHQFRQDPRSPPVVITLVFAGAALATLPLLFGVWASLGANLNHASEAFTRAPVSHGLFIGSVVALEGVFILYYKSWTLFEMLPAAAVIGLVTFFSGSRALSEVQGRRLSGKR